jgi:hypothetical protein
VRFAAVGLALVMAAEVAVSLVSVLSAAAHAPRPTLGYDFQIYVDRTQSWLGGEGFYRARQLDGPYSIEGGDALYPPPAILLFLPWALGAPPLLWWAIPAVIAVIALIRLRPPAWAWLVLLATLVLVPRLSVAIVLGNPSLWVFAAILAGWAFQWPAVIALLKPALALFAFGGARGEAWWRAVGIALTAALAFAPMWPDYARVLLDAKNTGDIEYVIGEIPIALALSLVGYAGFRRSSCRRASLVAADAFAVDRGAAQAASTAIA